MRFNYQWWVQMKLLMDIIVDVVFVMELYITFKASAANIRRAESCCDKSIENNQVQIKAEKCCFIVSDFSSESKDLATETFEIVCEQINREK